MSGLNKMKQVINQRPQVLVCQRGARHRYAIPRMFHEAGMLAALYTDSNAYSFAGRLARGLSRLGVPSASLNALASRVPLGVPADRVFSCARPHRVRQGKGVLAFEMNRTMKRKGLRGSNVVYSMYGENVEFVRWAKAQGARILIDIFVHPATNRIVDEQALQVTGRHMFDAVFMENVDERSREIFSLADILLCPSEWVAGGVKEFAPACAEKVRVVPYGSSLAMRDVTPNSPVTGRVLFAGREPLRKGLHHLAEAAALARRQGVQIDVRVAGVEKEQIGWLAHGEELNVLGTLPLNRMQAEFELADVFVLPSLSEGQASVIAEAMACGCPVIATRESGVDFMSDCGVVVPAADPAALANALAAVVGNRSYRAKLAAGAQRQASEYSMAAWKKRLIYVVEEAVSLSEGDPL